MDKQRWQAVERLFEQALAEAPAGRERFLAAACGGDDALRREVDELLAHHGAAEDDGFLPQGEIAGFSGPPEEDPYIGADLGPYRVQRRLGGGGMGNVYLAQRHADFRQQVAIKVLRRDMDSDDILARFQNEIQVLAALSKHGNIAALLDAGATSDGLPYFVMEYVDGEPVDAYADHHKLSLAERVALFAEVCGAVQFAHQHMIIHRDLKMSNILVRADGVVKLIDFGIAKLTTPELGARTMIETTVFSRFMTPDYASPEQVRGDPLTTASDVYALGVVLYELLIGRKPYALAELAPGEQLAMITEHEPPPPSRALSQPRGRAAAGEKPNAKDSTSRMRATTPKRLRGLLAGDLDNIVLKALRKEPQRRYATAAGLADDLARFLDGRPVEARPIGTGLQAYRWCRRHPMPTALLATVAACLAFGVWHVSRLADQLVEATAIEGAALEAQTLSAVQDFYAKEVVANARGQVPVTHRYRAIEGAIPVPASFTIDLGRHLKKSGVTGMSARLYSDHPFESREDGGPADDFEAEALAALRRAPDRPFYRFEPYDGRPSLRYATARVMQQPCVDCHNAHPDSPKQDWKVGEVRGVLQVIRPLDLDTARVQRRLSDTFAAMFGVAAVLALLALAFLRFGRRKERT